MSNMASCIGNFSILYMKNADMLLFTINIGITYECSLYTRTFGIFWLFKSCHCGSAVQMATNIYLHLWFHSFSYLSPQYSHFCGPWFIISQQVIEPPLVPDPFKSVSICVYLCLLSHLCFFLCLSESSVFDIYPSLHSLSTSIHGWQSHSCHPT